MAEYRAKRGDSLYKIAQEHVISFNQLLGMNPRYKADPNRLDVGDRVVVPDKPGKPLRPPEPEPVPGPSPQADPGPADSATDDWFTVPMGQLTFDAEGLEKPGSPYHSRVPHVPGRWSGVTIGRGFDMSQRSKEAIKTDLRQAGIPGAIANKLSGCAGFKGSRAKAHLREQELEELEITLKQQYYLFLDSYEELAGDVIRICRKSDVVEKYSATDWDGLDPIIRDIAVDLRYRGDYTPATRNRVQPIIVANSRSRLKRLMADEQYWRFQVDVPRDRFERRGKYIERG